MLKIRKIIFKTKRCIKGLPEKIIRIVIKVGITAKGINILFLTLLVVGYFMYKWVNNISFEFSDFIDPSTVVAIILVFICNVIAIPISTFLNRKYEDRIKLSDKYDDICKKYYKDKLLEYENYKYPIIKLSCIKIGETYDITIDDSHSNDKYILPIQAAMHSDEIFSAHKYSNTYNNMNVRLDSIVFNDNNVKLTYSNTTYYNSLVTNRAADYLCNNGMTIREIYEPGPFLSSLDSSLLSNHLGFNGFVKLVDSNDDRNSKFIFVKRDKDVSIGKDTLSPSVAASMKVKYCYDENKKLTLNGLSNAIKCEIKDELKIDVEDINLCDSIFAFYRDIVEAGKPQFLFYYEVKNLTPKQFEDNFKKEYKITNESEVDGTEFKYYTIDEIRECILKPGFIQIGKNVDKFKITPSAEASIIMLLEHLGCNKPI